MKHGFLICLLAIVSSNTSVSLAAEQAETPAWWLKPQRMIQTNLREIDATMDVDRYVQEVRDFGVVLFEYKEGK